MPERAEGPAGRVTTRVRYPETDRMGVAHHTHYLVWFELGRTELMRDLGCAYGELEEKERIFFPVVEVGATYRAPARYDEVVAVTTRLVSKRGATVRFEYTVERAGDGTILATGFSEHAPVDGGGKAMRLPERLRRRLAGAEESGG